ncbi:MAG: ATP-binding cassette domain-containing protein, partial [Oscillospiraceae bacterium]|nr:ATP-binding cassette domain-containing protein [Oscillospiraceae bacterium]
MTEYSIRAEGLYKRFGEPELLRGVSLELPLTGVSALMGPSGCGKTTLLLILAGLLEPDAGRVEAAAGLRRAMVFQDDRLPESAAVRYNVELPLRGARAAR